MTFSLAAMLEGTIRDFLRASRPQKVAMVAVAVLLLGFIVGGLWTHEPPDEPWIVIGCEPIPVRVVQDDRRATRVVEACDDGDACTRKSTP